MPVAEVTRVHRLPVWFPALFSMGALVAIGAGVARAQPAAAAAPATATAAPDAAADWSPIGADGWPIGVSLESVRALPPCGPEGLAAVPGAAIRCRPAVVAGSPQWAFGLDWTSGATFGDVATIGGAHALGAELDFSLLRTVEVGARYELTGVGVPAAPGADGSAALDHHLFALVKRRLFTDEVGRNAWTLGAGLGWALRGDALGGSAPLVRASLAREVGMYLTDDDALTAAVELAYERSLGAEPLNAVLASIRLGWEINIRAPRNLGTAAPTGWRHTTSFDVLAGPFLGLGMTVGLRASPRWSLETSGQFLFDPTSDLKLHGLDGASWAVMTGPRLQPFGGSVAWLYLQAQGGAAWVARDPAGGWQAVAQGEVGVRFLVCDGGFDVGAWVRTDPRSGFDVTAGGMVLRGALGHGAGAAGGRPGRIRCRWDTPHLATRYVPPPPAPPARTATVTAGTGGVSARLPDVDAHVAAGASVDVHARIPSRSSSTSASARPCSAARSRSGSTRASCRWPGCAAPAGSRSS